MGKPLQIGTIVVLLIGVMVVAMIDWRQVTPGPPSEDDATAEPGTGTSTDTDTGTEEPIPAGDGVDDPVFGAGSNEPPFVLPETYDDGTRITRRCYTGDWIGCWEWVDNTERPPLRVMPDGCTIEDSRMNKVAVFVYGYELEEREVIGSGREKFHAPRGSVVFYVLNASRYPPDGAIDPQEHIDAEREANGRVPDDSSVISGWAILSENLAGQRTFATVAKHTSEPGTDPVVPNEYRLRRVACE